MINMAKKKKVNKLNAFLGVIIIILLIALSVGIYVLVNNPEILHKEANNSVVNENLQNEVEEVIPEDTVINIVGIGDSLCHSQNFKDAYDSETGRVNEIKFKKNRP